MARKAGQFISREPRTWLVCENHTAEGSDLGNGLSGSPASIPWPQQGRRLQKGVEVA